MDVCVEGMVGGTPVNVCLECRDHARPADVRWVDEMKSKHERLPTHALILCSRSGFTNNARELARLSGIEAISFEEVERADLSELLKGKSSLWHKCMTINPEKVVVTVLPTPTLPAEKVAVMVDNSVFAADGTLLGIMGELVKEAIPLALRQLLAEGHLLAEGEEKHCWFQLQWELPRDKHGNSFFLQKLEPLALREIQTITIEGSCDFRIVSFGLSRGKLGEVEVAWAKTELFGKAALIAATRDAAGVETMSINVAGNPLETLVPGRSQR